MKEYKIYCAGQFISTEEHLEVINPFSGKVFARTYLASEKNLEEAIIRAQSVTEELIDWPVYKRYDVLMQVASSLEINLEEMSKTLCLESAKPIRYARGEVARAIQSFRVAAEEAKRLPMEYISLDWTPPGTGKEGLVKYFPVGPVAAISPFNFPLNLAVHKIAPAIAAGCPIILKPSSSTPLSTLLLSEIIDKTELPKGSVSVLPMDRKTGNNLVTDERFKLLTFTGSPDVGWQMKKDVGKKKVVLELGGNAGVIVTETADIDQAVQKCLIGGFAYSGQVCIHAQRFYVKREIFREFSDKLVLKVEKLVQGDPMDPETEISSMIDMNNAVRVEQWVRESLDEGARVLIGGSRNDNLYSPTILTGTTNNMKVCKNEIFGPVVTLEPYDHFDEALREVNASSYGLQAGVFTNKLNEMNLAFRKLEVGGVIINDVPSFRVDHMPYGGIKESGLGREGIRYAMHDMLEPRILVKNR